MSAFKGFAVISSAAIAAVASVLLADYLPAAGDNEWGYPALGYAAVIAAWVACISWAIDQRLLAVPSHILSVFAPWGYLYPVPLLAVILAIAAGATFKSSRQAKVPPSPF